MGWVACDFLGKGWGVPSPNLPWLVSGPRLTRLHHALTLLTLGGHLGEDLLWAWRRGRRGEALGWGLQPALPPPPAPSFSVNVNMLQSPRNLLGCLPFPGRTPPSQRTVPTYPHAPGV